MWHIAFYLGCLVATNVYAVFRGGASERFAVGALTIGTVLTLLVQAKWFEGDFRTIQLGVFTVDALLCVAAVTLAMASSKFWPLWFAALTIVQVLSHLPKLLSTHVVPFAYAVIVALWAYPMLVTIAVGTYRHHRRMSVSSAESSWLNSLTD